MSNESIRDDILKNRIQLKRKETKLLRDMLEVLKESELYIILKLETEKEGLVGEKARLTALLKDIVKKRQSIWEELQSRLNKELSELRKSEIEIELAILEENVPINYKFAEVPFAVVAASVSATPIRGNLLKDWINGLSSSDILNISKVIRLGLIEGLSIDQIKKNLLEEGFSKSQNLLASIVRTSINEISNSAREEVWKRNKDVIKYLVWTSVLDGRTSKICAARDGMVTSVEEGGKLPKGYKKLTPRLARPPAHINCRSVMVPVISAEGLIGERPFISSSLTRDKREINFELAAREKFGESWEGLSASRKSQEIKKARDAWSDENIGTIPAKVTYSEWLKRQSKELQDEILGKTKARLFRSGKLTLDKFVDFYKGRNLTLKELRDRYPNVFSEV